MDGRDKRAIVLDTSALIAGFDPFSMGEDQFTVPGVDRELRENSMSGIRVKMAKESGKLKVRAPKDSFIDKAKESATFMGDMFSLSDADLQVLALALELRTNGYRPLIATDDYSMQNVANQIGLEFAPLATFGIRQRLQWIRYCPACRRKYPLQHTIKRCEVCGTELKRKPLRKSGLQARRSGGVT